MTRVQPLDLEARRPVWEALSSLFLDTDTSLSRVWRAGLLAASPYSVAELEHILVDEVYPVCSGNLVDIAGEWAGFDPVWLEERITRRLQSPFRKLHSMSLGNVVIRMSAEWPRTKAAVLALRSVAGASDD